MTEEGPSGYSRAEPDPWGSCSSLPGRPRRARALVQARVATNKGGGEEDYACAGGYVHEVAGVDAQYGADNAYCGGQQCHPAEAVGQEAGDYGRDYYGGCDHRHAQHLHGYYDSRGQHQGKQGVHPSGRHAVELGYFGVEGSEEEQLVDEEEDRRDDHRPTNPQIYVHLVHPSHHPWGRLQPYE